MRVRFLVGDYFQAVFVLSTRNFSPFLASLHKLDQLCPCKAFFTPELMNRLLTPERNTGFLFQKGSLQTSITFHGNCSVPVQLGCCAAGHAVNAAAGGRSLASCISRFRTPKASLYHSQSLGSELLSREAIQIKVQTHV